MRTLFHFPLLACLFLFTISCEKDRVDLLPEVEPLAPERISFQNPMVGQFNRYESMSFECGQATPDERGELTLTITAVSPTEIAFSETISGQTTAYEYTAERVPGNLLISPEERQGSRLFYFYGSDSIRLDAEPVATLKYQDCVFFDGAEKFTGDYVASIPSFALDGREYRDLKSVSCVPVILGLDGYLLYNEHSLFASITASGSEFNGEESWWTTVYLLQDATGE